MAYDLIALRELILKAKGSRTQAEFAESCGLTPQHLSRLLTAKNPPRPSRRTLEKIAKGAGLSLEPFLKATGYYERGSQTRTFAAFNSRVEDIEEAFSSMTKNTRIFEGFDAVFREFDLFYGVNDTKYQVYEECECEEEGRKGAEYYAGCAISFPASGRRAKVFFVIFYCKTLSGKIVLTDFALDGETLIRLDAIPQSSLEKFRESGLILEEESVLALFSKEDKSAEERLLEAIFGTTGSSNEVPYTYVGLGFYVDRESFDVKAFKKRHEMTLLQLKLKGRVPADILDSEDIAEPETHEMIGYVLSEESGLIFSYVSPDGSEKDGFKITGNASSDAVMIIGYYDNPNISSEEAAEAKRFARDFAKEFGADSYGMVYVQALITIDDRETYSIDKQEGE